MAKRYAPYPQITKAGRRAKPKVKQELESLLFPTHVFKERTASLPRFLRNLWTMINDPAGDIIGWEGDRAFVITNKEVFAKTLLPKFFKHNKISSFIRQLHLYQFTKVKNTYHPQWTHKYLSKFDYQSFCKIQRRSQAAGQDKKMQAVIREMRKKILEQQLEMARMQRQMVKFEKDVKGALDLHEAMETMEKELFEVRKMLTVVSLSGELCLLKPEFDMTCPFVSTVDTPFIRPKPNPS